MTLSVVYSSSRPDVISRARIRARARQVARQTLGWTPPVHVTLAQRQPPFWSCEISVYGKTVLGLTGRTLEQVENRMGSGERVFVDELLEDRRKNTP